MLFSTLFLVAIASFSAAHPSKAERSSRIVARAPELGSQIVVTKTTNDPVGGTYTADGSPVTIRIINKIGEGSYGKVYLTTCDGDADCASLGPVVVKYHTKNIEIEEERNSLARINQLKAVFDDKFNKDYFTVMELRGGSNLSRLQEYIDLLKDEIANRDAINALVDQVIAMTTADAQSFITNNLIFHRDVTEANVLLVSDGAGQITHVNIIDWGSADFLQHEDIEGASAAMAKQVEDAFSRFRR